MPKSICIASGPAGFPSWSLRIEGALRDDTAVPGQGNSFEADAVVLDLKKDAAQTLAVLRAKFPTSFQIDGRLLDPILAPDPDAGQLRLKPLNAQVQVLLDEVHRRLSMQEIVWKTDQKQTFLKLQKAFDAQASGSFRGDLRIKFDANGALELAEFAARAALELKIDDKNGNEIDARRSVALVLSVNPNAIPRIRLDLDDFNFGFPEIEFPDLDLSMPRRLPFPNLNGVARVFRRFADAAGKHINVETAASTATPTLRIDATGGALRWWIAESGADNAPLAVFTVKIKEADAAQPFVTIDNLTLEHSDTRKRLTGKVTVDAAAGVSFDIPPPAKPVSFGPLVIRWSELKIVPAASAVVSTPIKNLDDVTLRALVTFRKLMIYPADDPTAVIAFDGEVEVTPSGTRILGLRLVEPYPLKLIENAYEVLEQAAEGLLKLLAEIKRPALDVDLPPFIEGLKRLLDVLGRIAAAVGRATVFVADAAAELVSQALRGLAEAVGRLAQAIGELMADAAKAANRHLAFEIRIATDPFEIRQVLVTLRRSAPGPGHDRLSALGFDLEIPTGWEPGLLLDFVAAPGAYVIATRQADKKPDSAFATLSTDLWLKHGDEPVQPMRDASGASGERGQSSAGAKPLLSVAASVKNGTAEFVLILAGLRAGHSIFFHKVGDADGHVVRTKVGGAQNLSVVTADGPFVYHELKADEFNFNIEFEKDRVLPLLGMGEPGAEPTNTGTSFLDRLKGSLSQTVWVKKFDKNLASPPKVGATLLLGIKAAGVESEVSLRLEIDIRTMQAKFKGDAGPLKITSRRIEENALGLVWVVEQKDEGKRSRDEPVEMFTMSFEKGETSFVLNDEQAQMEVRFTELSSDGRGVVLKVSEFRISRAGLDLTAKVTGKPVYLNGLKVPFEFTTGEFAIRAGRVTRATIGGRGSLPRDLVGEVECAVLLDFRQEPDTNAIVLQSGKVEFGKKGEPIVSKSTRFTLTINDLDIAFKRDGGYHFYFLVTGALQFTPGDGDKGLTSGLLKYLKDVRIDLERAPLTADPRVLLKHISFQKALNPKKTFSLFSLFEFELRGFGYHPASPKFGGSPAMNISGQIKFAQIGDVMQPKIDFHGLWIAPPEGDKPFPRIKADGLGVDLGLSGVAKIRGTVLAVDPQTTTVEGLELAPPGFEASGFLGEGHVSIEGWATMSASMGFLEVARKETPDDKKKSFFLFLQAEQLAVQIPVVIWTFYLREVGFGFGYRYTLRGIKEAENATSVAKLVKTLDEVSKRQGDLSRFSAWMPDPEGDKFTLALRGAFQCYPTTDSWDESYERTAEEPFFFDVVAALRSDMTFLMAARGWVATNYWDFLSDTEGKIRNHPGFRGYLYISAPRSELLMRSIGDSTGYVGDRLGDIDTLKQALKSVDWSSTLYINPRLFHFELGWPNELVVRLKNEPNFRVTVRGGMIFRVTEDGLLYGYNIEADAFIVFSGGLNAGAVGVSIEASLVARFVARLIAFLSWKVKGTLIYGLISLDANPVFRVRAWMEIDLGFKSFTIRISFSYSVQFSAAVEIAISTEGVGARVTARIAVSAFGCTLGVGINFSISPSKLDDARARVQRFLALGITNEATPDPAKFSGVSRSDEQVAQGAEQGSKGATAPILPTPQTPANEPKPRTARAALGRDIHSTDFWLVLHAAGSGTDEAYGLLVPRQPTRIEKNDENEDITAGGFYSSPHRVFAQEPVGATLSHKLLWVTGNRPQNVKRWDAATQGFGLLDTTGPTDVETRWDVAIPVEKGDSVSTDHAFRLGHLFDECFLYDAEWRSNPELRITVKWAEPPARWHSHATDLPGSDDEDRKRRRDNVQRDRAATATANPIVAAVYDARSTVMSMFLHQFVSFATSEKRDDLNSAHVTDLGLVFRGAPDQFEHFKYLKVKKVDAPDAGSVEVFNPRHTWFDVQDPSLDRTKDPRVEVDGVKVDWRLRLPFAGATDQTLDPRQDPEQFLHHYEIVAEINDRPRWQGPKFIKPAATEGGTEKGHCTQVRCDWQFVDDLADLEDSVRRALLPTTGEEKALAAAAAWVANFGHKETVSLTYSVTPVDIAGTRGSEKSFIVEVARRQPPIRPATAELRFIVNGPSNSQHTDSRPPKNLGIVIALNDQAWEDDTGFKKNLGNGRFASRAYRLIVDPEDVVPSGNYGSDGLTDRLNAPPSGAAQSGDEKWFDFGRPDLPRSRYKDASVIEPDPDARKRFDNWLRLAGSPAASPAGKLLSDHDQNVLFDTLWRREAGGRVATRFYLETRVTIEQTKVNPDDPKVEPVTFTSRRVPVDFEVVIHPPTEAMETQSEIPVGPVIFRPVTFEWPVRLDLPPLGKGQVRTNTGFALLRAPGAQATLGSILAAEGSSEQRIVSLRDPERRVLTTIEWDAVPDWAGANAPEVMPANGQPHPLHAQTVGGFDLHELDIDDVAPLDTTTIGRLPFATDAGLWSRARRVARVQLLPASSAMLVPHTNDDLLGWHAHYPSETWRVSRGDTQPPSGDHKPTRRGWWSARESTPRFARRLARRRLMPYADENATTELLRRYAPERIYVKLEPRVETPAQKILAAIPADVRKVALRIILAKVSVDYTNPESLSAGFIEVTSDHNDRPGWQCFQRKSAKPFRPVDLRILQLCLAWNPGRQVDDALASDRTAFDGLVLRLASGTTIERLKYETSDGSPTLVEEKVSTSETDVPLSFNSSLHPVLEETLAELALDFRGSDSSFIVYRRYTPVLQPPPQIDAKDLAGFLNATVEAKDPYGWGVLHALGFSATVQLFDGDRDAFVESKDLLDRVNAVMTGVIARYVKLLSAVGDERPQSVRVADALGVPFAEVMLRPGRDRVPGPFDAMDLPGPERLKFDDTLAMVQLSLRPRVETVWHYYRLAASWRRELPRREPVLHPEKPDEPVKFDAGVVVALKPDARAAVDVIRPADSRIVELKSKEPDLKEIVTLPALGAPNLRMSPDPALTLLLRVPVSFASSPEEIKTKIESVVTLKVVKRTRSLNPIADKDILDDPTGDPWIGFGDQNGFSISQMRYPGEGSVDVFDQFAPKNVDDWYAAFFQTSIKDENNKDVPVAPLTDAFEVLRQSLIAAFPKMRWPEDESGRKSALGIYLDWAQRFLDHGARAAEDPTNPLTPVLNVALAAPTKATPWRLGASSDGTLSLSFLHADRWAHARAYAVKPFGRYQELMIAAGAYADAQTLDREAARTRLERLVNGETKFSTPLGYGVAFSPRTENIEPPVVIGSKLQKDGSWQLVVARHNEEGLAFSNRPLFGRLGWEGLALSFVRDYREPEWPDRLAAAIESMEVIPKAVMHPTKMPEPKRSSAPNGVPDIFGHFGSIVREFPNLWKGADVYRFANLPHHYRVTVVASARAGIVVSPLTTAVQEDFQATMPDLTNILQTRAGSICIVVPDEPDDDTLDETRCKTAEIRISIPLLSYVDLMNDATRKTWVDEIELPKETPNIARWPDPDVVYALRRKSIPAAGAAPQLEEDAELRLVPRGNPDAAATDARPLVVRARGSRFQTAASPPKVNYKPDGFAFGAEIPLALASRGGSGVTATLDSINEDEINEFNNAKEPYGVILWRHDLAINLLPATGETVDDIIVRLLKLAGELIKLADSAALDPAGACRAVAAFGRELQQRVKQLTVPPATPADAVGQAGLPRTLQLWWPYKLAFPLVCGVQDSSAVDCTFSAQPVPAVGASWQPYLSLLKPLAEISITQPLPPSLKPAVERAMLAARYAAIATGQLPATALAITEAEIKSFNAKTRRFARILVRYRLTLDVEPTVGESVDDFIARIGNLAKLIVTVCKNSTTPDPGRALIALGDRGRQLVEWVDAHAPGTPNLPADAAAAREAAGLPGDLLLWWAPPQDGQDIFPLDISTEAAKDCKFSPLTDAQTPPYLALLDLPSCKENGRLAAGDPTPAFKAVVELLQFLTTELVTGGARKLTLRAVHGRARPLSDADFKKGLPGVTEGKLTWPNWFRFEGSP